MGYTKNHRRSFAVAVVATGLGLSVLIGGLAVFGRDDTVVPPSKAEAEAVLDDVVGLAQAGDFTSLCQSHAAATGICRNLVESARQAGWSPGPARPDVTGVTLLPSGTTVLHLSGTRADGSPFKSDFGVVRDDQGLRSTTPIYWSGVTIAG